MSSAIVYRYTVGIEKKKCIKATSHMEKMGGGSYYLISIFFFFLAPFFKTKRFWRAHSEHYKPHDVLQFQKQKKRLKRKEKRIVQIKIGECGEE